MAFRFDDRMIHDYWQNGYMVFRGILPGSLVRDLRREIDKIRSHVHTTMNSQTQRLQPVKNFPQVCDFAPFQAYAELPELADAVTRLLGPDYVHSIPSHMGVLVEPSGHSYHHGWHRDGLVEVPTDARDERLRAVDAKRIRDNRFFNQVNCAIYNDSCTWFVPGSHLRVQDLPGEHYSSAPDQLVKPADMSTAEFEALCLDECRDFPGAVQMHLAAGDFMVYRNNAWHCGNYLSYQPRGTIHDTCAYHGDRSDVTDDWQQEKKDAVLRMQARRTAAAG